MPKASVLGRSYDLLLLIVDANIANYVNDSILYAPKHPQKIRTESLTSLKIWFKNKYLKANSGKSQVMWTTDDEPNINVG